jgi:Tol biopolymer transport system component
VRLEGGSQDLWQVRLSDRVERALSRTPEREESWPYWSEAAVRLVFEGAERRGDRISPSDLWLLDPATGSERRLARTPRRSERWPAWSPGGGRVAFAFWGGRPVNGIALADPQSGALELVAGGAAGDSFLRPAFAPDGARLVAQRRAAGAGADSDLWLLAPGRAPEPLVRDPRWFDWKPQFSRDGASVYFSRRPVGGGPADVASVAVDGGDLRSVVAGPADEHSAAPSPVRDEIAFVSDRGGASAVFLAGLGGEGARALARAPGWNGFAPRWSPDGERIAIVATPAVAGAPRLGDPESLAQTRLRVVDREGRLLLDTPGFMADWMSPWP